MHPVMLMARLNTATASSNVLPCVQHRDPSFSKQDFIDNHHKREIHQERQPIRLEAFGEYPFHHQRHAETLFRQEQPTHQRDGKRAQMRFSAPETQHEIHGIRCPERHGIGQGKSQIGVKRDLVHSPMLPTRKIEIKKKDDENAKKEAQSKELLAAKVEKTQREVMRRKSAQRLYTLSKQADNQQLILNQVKEDMIALGADTTRIEQVIAVLKKVEIVLAKESAKL